MTAERHSSTRRLACVLAVVAAVGCATPASEPAEPPPSSPALNQAQKKAPAAEAKTPTAAAPETEAAAPTTHEAPAAEPAASAKPKLSRDAMCEGICARAAELKCAKANDCPKMCAETMKVDVCGPELSTATECVLARPISDWQCTAQGVASIKDAFCVDEQKAFGDCLIAASPKP